MDTRTAHLLRIVREETGLYRDLLEHSNRKTALLVEGRLEPLLESNKVDETFSIKLRILESEAERLRNELSSALGIPPAEFTLARLARTVGPPMAAEIEADSLRLRAILEELKQVNRRNARLLESSMRYSRVLADYLADRTGSYRGTGFFTPLAALGPTLSRQA
jgi:hypothetical protein